MNDASLPGLFLFCRSGYEKDCAAEIQTIANEQAISGYCKTQPNSGHVLFCTLNSEDAKTLYSSIDFSQLIFARQWFICFAQLSDLPEKDRVTPIVDSIETISKSLELKFNKVIVQQANMESENNLQRFISAFTRPLLKSLQEHEVLTNEKDTNETNLLELCFTNNDSVYIGLLPKGNSWPGGIPRLKLPGSAPSRSYLKLEEAFIRFIGNKRDTYLKPAMTATDLGAAPGGWSWLLVQNHIKVTSVDNGPMNDNLLDSGLCTHVTEDAFAYRPDGSCDWLVCDIVDKPMRVLALIHQWIEHKACDQAIFNLKLPMQQRYKFIQENVLPWLNDLIQNQMINRWKAKHLYHDRHEITIMIE